MRKRRVRGVLTVALVAWMAVIYFFSAENGEESTSTSDRVVDTIVTMAEEAHIVDESGLSAPARERLSFFVRKGAHAVEYTILAALSAACLLAWGVRRCRWIAPLAWAFASIYAMTDEYHQLAVAGRAGQWSDVCVDALGAAIGVGIFCLALWRVRRKRSGNA